MEWQYLHVSIQHNCFAPLRESNRIRYRNPLIGTVHRLRLRVTDGDGIKVYEREYDVSNGMPQLLWDGSINHNPPNDAPAYVNPMRSPFSAEVHALVQGALERQVPKPKPKELSDTKSPTSLVSTCSKKIDDEETVTEDEMIWAPPSTPEPRGSRHTTEFRVKFHSMQVVRGDIAMMTPNPGPATNAKRCKELNRLGYYAGPPSWIGQNGVRGSYFTRARDYYNTLRGTRSLDNALAADWAPCPGVKYRHNDGWAAYPTGTALHNAKLRLYVESLPYTAAGLVNGLRDQLELAGRPHGRAGREEATLNRPLVPFEVRFLIRDSNGQGVDVPEAVGKVRIDWTIENPEEQWNNIGADARGTSRYGRRYVKQAVQALGGQGGLGGNARRKINCPQTPLGGAAVADQWKSAAMVGDGIIGPHGAQLDNDNKRIITYASVDTNQASRLGKAVLMFRPSAVAGDRYKITAHAFFRGLGRRHALRRKNPTMKVVSGEIEVWRWVPVGVVLNWGSTKPIDNELFNRVKPRFAEAYTEIDTSTMVTKTPSQLLQNGDYAGWVNGSIATFTDADMRAMASNAFAANPDNDSIIAPNMASHGVLATPNGGWDSIKQSVRTRFQNDAAKRIRMILAKMFNSPQDREIGVVYGSELFLQMVQRRARALRPRGFVIINAGFGTALADAGINVGSMEQQFMNMVRSCTGEQDMHVLMWDHRPEKFDYVLAHEMAHCLGLRHYENAGDKNPNDHDKADHNCVMSYSATRPPHQRAEVYSPMFCGKCNLKLRGWAVHTGLLAEST